MTGALDKVTLIRPDTLARMHRAYTREQFRWQRRLQLKGTWEAHKGTAEAGVPDACEGSTDDVKKAFRRLPVSEVFVVCLYNPVTSRMECILVPGFIFGCFAAVHGWNRYPAIVMQAARRLLACIAAMYFDDKQQLDPAFARGSGQDAIGVLVSLIGVDFELEKHVTNDQKTVALGVDNDFSHAPNTHTVTVSVSDSRKQSVCDMIDVIKLAGTITHAAAQSVFGKCRYALCPQFGRLGLAALQPLRDVLRVADVVPGNVLWSALSTIQRVTRALQPHVVHLMPRTDPRVLVFTDASQHGVPWRPDYCARVGVYIKDLANGRSYYTYRQAPRWLVIKLIELQYKKTYICQFELIGVVCAYLTFPDVLRGRLVHHFIDNEAALYNCIGGYSGKPDSALVIAELHIALAKLGCRPWFSFVYSEDNIADLPSRFDFLLMRQLGAIRRECVLPSLLAW